MGFAKVAVIALGAVFSGTAGAVCAPGPDGERGFMEFGAKADALRGHQDLCRRLPAECAFRAPQDLRVVLDDATWALLVRVNDSVNRRLTGVEDKELYGVDELWTFPEDNKGDCEDFALLKRRELIEAGWAPSALSIAMVINRDGEGHAVLVARTDQGDFILDNLNRAIMNPQDTGYDFRKAITPQDYNAWQSVTVRPALPRAQPL